MDVYCPNEQKEDCCSNTEPKGIMILFLRKKSKKLLCPPNHR